MSLSPEVLLAFLQSLTPETIEIVMIIVAYGSIVGMVRWFGATGAYVYIALAICAANMQVLKAVQYSFYPDPIALGTVLFASTYLCTDILNEYYGKDAARKAVWVGFAGYLLMTVFMLLALGYAPLTPEQAGDAMAWNLPYHGHLAAIFTPAPAFFAASMLAYLTSQLHDVWLYDYIRAKTKGKWLWLRNNASTLVSSFIDNVIFNVFAWVIFAEQPMETRVLIHSYILGTYGLRVALALIDTPFMYLARRLIKKHDTVS
jgi:uncharacterized integral membrane protein (TIGR00697 family)